LSAVVSTILALFVSYYFNLKPGGTIILINVALLVLIALVSFITQRLQSKKLSQ
ncbi:MAG: metal ABC transporter permease, partial [Coriobacteriia bacterium]|nr:metal ABC transporter permease [Coriobacteriia bacterium]